MTSHSHATVEEEGFPPRPPPRSLEAHCSACFAAKPLRNRKLWISLQPNRLLESSTPPALKVLAPLQLLLCHQIWSLLLGSSQFTQAQNLLPLPSPMTQLFKPRQVLSVLCGCACACLLPVMPTDRTPCTLLVLPDPVTHLLQKLIQ